MHQSLIKRIIFIFCFYILLNSNIYKQIWYSVNRDFEKIKYSFDVVRKCISLPNSLRLIHRKSLATAENYVEPIIYQNIFCLLVLAMIKIMRHTELVSTAKKWNFNVIYKFIFIYSSIGNCLLLELINLYICWVKKLGWNFKCLNLFGRS